MLQITKKKKKHNLIQQISNYKNTKSTGKEFANGKETKKKRMIIHYSLVISILSKSTKQKQRLIIYN